MVNREYWMVCKGGTPINDTQHFSYFTAMLVLENERKKQGDDTLWIQCFLETDDDTLGAIDKIERDNINSPVHYTSGGIECIEAIRAALTPEEFRGFCKGNVIKYVWRERLKGGDESLKKAEWYLKRLTDGAN
jgi:hypothetical protein